MSDSRGFVGVDLGRLAVFDVTVGARPRADAAEDHEGCRAVVPTLSDVWAICFLADRVEGALTNQLLEAQVAGAAG